MEDQELIVVEEKNIELVFKKGGCDPLIKELREKLEKFKPDISTAAGRKEIASFAYRFSKAKVYIDDHGKALVDAEKAKLKIVDAERRKFRDECDVMRDEARKPLTDWEDAEKQRVSDIETRIRDIENFVEQVYIDAMGSDITSAHLSSKLDELKAIIIDESFEEFELAATKAKEAVLTQLEAKFIVLQNQEKEAAEAERLEKERLEKEQKEREEKIAKEAAATATKEAEEKAAKEAEEKEQKEKEEKERLERETLEAKLATERAEREKKETEEKAERDKKEALDKAEREKREAIEDEKKRQEDEKRKEKEAEEKRQANKRHRGKINREAKESFVSEGLKEAEAEKIITMIAKGLIANITINY